MLPETNDLLLITLKYLHRHDQLALQCFLKRYPTHSHGIQGFPFARKHPQSISPFASVSLKLKALRQLTFAPSLMDIADAFFVV